MRTSAREKMPLATFTHCPIIKLSDLAHLSLSGLHLHHPNEFANVPTVMNDGTLVGCPATLLVQKAQLISQRVNWGLWPTISANSARDQILECCVDVWFAGILDILLSCFIKQVWFGIVPQVFPHSVAPF